MSGNEPQQLLRQKCATSYSKALPWTRVFVDHEYIVDQLLLLTLEWNDKCGSSIVMGKVTEKKAGLNAKQKHYWEIFASLPDELQETTCPR